MANKGKIDQFIDFESLEKEISATEKRFKGMYEDLSKLSVTFSSAGSSAKGATGIKEVKAAQDQLNATNQKAAKVVKDLTLEEAKLKEAQRQRNEATRDAAKIDGLSKDSMASLQVELKKLTKEYYNMSKAQREAAGGKELKTQIKSLNDGLRNLKTSMGDWKANVGNYRESLSALRNGFDGLGGKISDAATEIMGFGASLKGGAIGFLLYAFGAAVSQLTIAFNHGKEAARDAAKAMADYNKAVTDAKMAYKEKIDALKYSSDEERKIHQENADFYTATEAMTTAFSVKMQKIKSMETLDEATRLKLIQTAVKLHNLNIENLTNDHEKILTSIKKEGEKKREEDAKKAREKAQKDAEKVALERLNAEKQAVNGLILDYLRLARAIKGGTKLRQGPETAQVTTNTGEPLAGTPPATMQKIEGVSPTQPGSLTGEGMGRNAEVSAEAAVWNSKIQIAQQAVSQIDSIIESSFQNRFALLDQERQKDEAAKEKELAAAGNNKRKIDEINKRYAQRDAEREKERRRIEVQQAKYKKASGIVQAIINTALGVTQMLANPGGILGIVLAALAGLMGAAEVAVIASQPIPSYKKGRKKGKAEMAQVGEVGRELIVTKSGEMVLTPPTSTLTYLPEGSSVIPHHELLAAAGNAASFMPNYYSTLSMEGLKEEVRSLHGGFIMLKKTIEGKREVHLDINERGFAKSVRNGSNWETYLNNHVRL